MKNLKSRIAAMNFLEFAVWGAYLTSMGNYLGKAGMGAEIAWFYAIQGIVSIFMPTIMGIIADKFIQPQRLLGICHLLAGAGMVGLFMLGEGSATPDKTLFIAVYAFSVSFYMPTLALSNTAAFVMLKENGYDTVKDFPPIRVLGTVGFIATMWFVNCAVFADDVWFTLGDNAAKFQYTHFQFLVSGVLSLVLFTASQCRNVNLLKRNRNQSGKRLALPHSVFSRLKEWLYSSSSRCSSACRCKLLTVLPLRSSLTSRAFPNLPIRLQPTMQRSWFRFRK